MLYKEFLIDFIKMNKYLFVFYLCMTIILFPSETILLPRLYSKLIGNDSSMFIIKLIAVIWLILLVLYGLKYTVESYLLPRYVSFLRQKCFSLLLLKKSNDFSDIQSGEVISRFMTFSNDLKSFFHKTLNFFIPALITGIAITIYFYKLDKTIFIICVVTLLIFFSTVYFHDLNVVKNARERSDYFYILNEKLNNSFSNLLNVYLNNQTKEEINKNTAIETKYADLTNKVFNSSRTAVLTKYSLLIVSFVLSLIVAYNSYRSKRISTETFVSITIILIYFLNNFLKFSYELKSFFNDAGSILSCKDFIKNLFSSSDNSSIKNIINWSIDFKNISFKYSKTNNLFINNLTLRIKPNEKIAIIGSSGSGKSTLMKLLLKFHSLNSGSIEVGGINISKINTNYLRSKIIYINQKTQLFNDSIINNIKYGNNISDKGVLQLLNKYNLSSIYSRISKGIYANAGVNGNNLSLGMQKITIILRGILKRNNATVFVFDEPLAGLDKISREKVIKLILGECKDKTLLIITHDPEIVPYMDRSVNMIDINKK